jgi:predicted Na+-dependent transporter
MINWKPVAIGFVVTLILEIIGVLIGFWGMFVPLIISILAPVIGGLLAAYIAGGEYIDGARNGGLAGGFGSLVAAIIVLSGADLAAIIFSAIFSFILSAILGIIGGTIGIVLKGKPEELAEES